MKLRVEARDARSGRPSSSLVTVMAALVLPVGCVLAPTPGPTLPTGPTPGPAGNTLVSDDFEGDTKYLSSGTGRTGSGEYVAGVYRITAEPGTESINYFAGRTTSSCTGVDCSFPDDVNNQIDDAVVEVDATHVSGSATAGYGIACAYADEYGFFGLTISADGRQHAIFHTFEGHFGAELFLLHGGASHGDPHPAIKQGTGSTNHLRAECGEQSAALFVNGHLVATADFGEALRRYAHHGAGLIVGAGRDGPIEVTFDNLVVAELLQQPPSLPAQGIIFADPLSVSIGAWPIGASGGATSEFVDGSYRVSLETPATLLYNVPLTLVPSLNTSSEVTITHLAGPDTGYSGLSCRATDDGRYALYFRADGHFALHVLDARANQFNALVGWTQSEAIRAGIAQPNALRLDCVDDRIVAFINGESVAEVSDSTYGPVGQVALEVGTPGEQGGVSVGFKDLVVRHP